MRRTDTIVLVLMGGGLVLSGCDSRECRDARAQHRLDADVLCRQSTSSTGGHGGGSSWFGRSGGSSGSIATSAGSVSRGGFGAAGHAAAAGS